MISRINFHATFSAVSAEITSCVCYRSALVYDHQRGASQWLGWELLVSCPERKQQENTLPGVFPGLCDVMLVLPSVPSRSGGLSSGGGACRGLVMGTSRSALSAAANWGSDSWGRRFDAFIQLRIWSGKMERVL